VPRNNVENLREIREERKEKEEDKGIPMRHRTWKLMNKKRKKIQERRKEIEIK
jgi:hypothetical protein